MGLKASPKSLGKVCFSYNAHMTIVVEFYGMPREWAGVASATARGATLADVLRQLEQQFPRLAAQCLGGGILRGDCAANLNGQRFVSDPGTSLKPGDTLLIMSADAGG